VWGVGVAQGTGLFDGLDVELLVAILRHTGLKQRVHCAMAVCKAWRMPHRARTPDEQRTPRQVCYSHV
tara:strand:- start:271 stop:474 length:204 start_codon:yes stop_codon:yes gene_type:complete